MRLCQDLTPKRKQCVKFRNDCAELNEWNSVKLKVLLLGFHEINAKPKNVPLRDPLERPSDCRVSWTKESMKFTGKSVGFNRAAFLGFFGLIPVTLKQERNDGGKGKQFPRCRITAGGAEWLRGPPKIPNNVTSTSLSAVDFLLKDLRFEYRGAKLAFCPERHLTSPLRRNQMGVRGTCFYFQMTKTNGIHKLRFLQICLAVRHVVSR